MPTAPSGGCTPQAGVWATSSRTLPPMLAERIHAHPPRPLSEVEWEDLLLKLEVMTKAVRIAVEDAAGAADVTGLLQRLVTREVAAREFLERAAGEPSSAPREHSG